MSESAKTKVYFAEIYKQTNNRFSHRILTKIDDRLTINSLITIKNSLFDHIYWAAEDAASIVVEAQGRK